jgi:SPP1 family phage portal protein
MADFKFYGIPYIYTDKKSNPDTVIEIYKQTKTEASDILEHIKKLTDIYKGDQEQYIPDTDRKANEKNVVNYIKVFLDTVVSILFHKPVSYVSRKKEQEYLDDIDTIVAYMNDEGESDLNIATGTDMLVNGIGFQYCLQQGEEDPTPYSPFTLGRFDNKCTYAVHSTNIGNRVEVVFHIINYTDSLGNSVEKIIAYDSKNIYTIVSDDLGVDYRFEKVVIKNPLTDEEEYLDYISHDLPNNPVQLFENDIYRLSSVQDMWGLQKSLNNSISSYTNDMLLKINQLLTIFGVTLSDEEIEQMRNNNILNSPEVNAKVQFVASQLDNRAVEFINDTINRMNVISGAPSQGGSRAETGIASQTENGHTIANFNSNRKEQRFYIPKRKQLENVIAILRRTGKLKTDISSRDIEIKFDRNRLASITETVNNLRTLLLSNVRPIDALNITPLFEDNGSVAKGIEDTIKENRKYELALKNSNLVQNIEVQENEQGEQNETEE